MKLAAGLFLVLGPAAVWSCPWDAEVQSSAVAFALAHCPLHFPAGPGAVASAGPTTLAGWGLVAAAGPVWPQAGCHSRQGSSLGKVQRCLHHIGAVLGAGLTERGAMGLGGAGGVSGVPAALGGPEVRLLTMASCCLWASWIPAASGRLRRRSVLFPTSMSGLSVACGREGQLRAPWVWQPPAAAVVHLLKEP